MTFSTGHRPCAKLVVKAFANDLGERPLMHLGTFVK
jgi:hypothetical protein